MVGDAVRLKYENKYFCAPENSDILITSRESSLIKVKLSTYWELRLKFYNWFIELVITNLQS